MIRSQWLIVTCPTVGRMSQGFKSRTERFFSYNSWHLFRASHNYWGGIKRYTIRKHYSTNENWKYITPSTYLTIIKNPKTYLNHNCDPSWTDYYQHLTKKINMLETPLHFVFNRQTKNGYSIWKLITYHETSCGTHFYSKY